MTLNDLLIIFKRHSVDTDLCDGILNYGQIAQASIK